MFGAHALSGCEKILSEVDERLGGGIPSEIAVPDGVEIDADFHFLNRVSFGPRPGELELLKELGQKKWLEGQLDFASIDDRLSALRTRRFESRYVSSSDCFEFRKEVLRMDLVRHTLLKAIYSKRQLLEVMVNFWSDHLNINIEKGNCVYYKTEDDINVIRKNALGKFGDLIKSSALSPAMLEYLDGKDNKKGSARDKPNENYARELMELHTLGVDGGYSQRDVYEAARCLTGWKVKEKFGKGQVYFDNNDHDQGEKLVLGVKIAGGGGPKDLDLLLQIVSNHPATALHISRKLVRHFIGDSPSESIVRELAAVFRDTGGDIKAVLQRLLNSSEMMEQRGNKVKRPFRFVVSALRALVADTFFRGELIDYLTQMGQEPFQHPTPDGYPEETLPWLGTLLWRWNFSFALCENQIPSVQIDAPGLIASLSQSESKTDSIEPSILFRYLCGRKPDLTELQAIERYQSATGKGSPLTIGLILASPAFQRY